MQTTFNNKTILILAGGTGGHIFPALEIASRLKQQGVNIYWLGTKAGLESSLVPKYGIPIEYIWIGGVRGKSITKLLLTPIMLFCALLQAVILILKLKPDVILGMGGFVSGPPGVAAFLLGKKLIIHEQNSVAGTTNKLLSVCATRVLYAFPGAFPNTSSKFILTGNPIREAFNAISHPKERFKFTVNTVNILVLGGSRGAKAINECIPHTIAMFQAEGLDIPNVWHQTGDTLLAPTQELYARINIPAVKLSPFIEDMVSAYAWADLVICRAGALTITELTATGVGSILIPFPHAIDDHQTKNALYLVKHGAAILLPQQELSASNLFRILKNLIADKNKLRDMAYKAYQLANKDAAHMVVKYCLMG